MIIHVDNEKNTVSLGAEIASKIRETVQEFNKDSEKTDEKMMGRIKAKLKSGKKLSSKEESYLKQHDPELYIQYLRIRRMAMTLENQLKNADSKEEVNNIILHSYMSVSDKDPYKEYIIAALQEVEKEFKNTESFQQLPATSDEAHEHKKSSSKKDEDSFETDDDFDPMTWSPLQEIADAMPTFDSPA